MSADEQKQTRNDAEALLRQSGANLAAVRLKLVMAARSMDEASQGIRKYLEAPGHILLPDRLPTTQEISSWVQEHQAEENEIRRLNAELVKFRR
jgi:hypothetical protein